MRRCLRKYKKLTLHNEKTYPSTTLYQKVTTLDSIFENIQGKKKKGNVLHLFSFIFLYLKGSRLYFLYNTLLALFFFSPCTMSCSSSLIGTYRPTSFLFTVA